MGLRETKKELTRRRIADAAARLFGERGFDKVKVAEVAHAAQVSEATVFNYFPTKEDLFYSRLEGFGARLVEAVAGRPAGEPAIAAFRRFVLEASGQMARLESGDAAEAEAAAAALRTVNRVIAASPALLAREQRAFAATAEALARHLAAESGAGDGDVSADVAAHALMGVHRALVDHVRRRVLAGDDLTELPREVRRRGREAFDLLERGLGAYARKA